MAVVNWGAAVTVAGAIVVALIGYIGTYRNNVRLSARQAQLARLDRQLREFYGPLYALTEAGSAAWKALWEGQGREQPPQTLEELREILVADVALAATWQMWMRHIFMPLNRKRLALVEEKADLLATSTMPESLTDMCAHVYGYEAVLRQWEEGDRSSLTSVALYPEKKLAEHVREQFQALKAQQLKLLEEARAPLAGSALGRLRQRKVPLRGSVAAE